MSDALHRLCSSHPGTLALLKADKAHVLELIFESQRFFKERQAEADSDTPQSLLIADFGNRHRRKTLLSISKSSCQLAMKARDVQRGTVLKSVEVASIITSSMVTDMIRR